MLKKIGDEVLSMNRRPPNASFMIFPMTLAKKRSHEIIEKVSEKKADPFPP